MNHCQYLIGRLYDGWNYQITPEAPKPRTFISEYLSVVSNAVPMISLFINIAIVAKYI